MGYIKIEVTMKGKNGVPLSREAKVIIKDGISITNYNDIKFSKIILEKMIKDGKKVQFKEGSIIESYPGLKKEEIARRFGNDVMKLKEKNKLIMDVDYKPEIIE